MLFHNVIFQSTDTLVKVPESVIKLFNTIENMLNDITPITTSDQNIPIPEIYVLDYDNADLFFQYAYQIEQLTSDQSIQFIIDSTIEPDILVTYIQLANYLDYPKYFHTLCSYSSFLLRNYNDYNNVS